MCTFCLCCLVVTCLFKQNSKCISICQLLEVAKQNWHHKHIFDWSCVILTYLSGVAVGVLTCGVVKEETGFVTFDQNRFVEGYFQMETLKGNERAEGLGLRSVTSL